MYDDQLKINEFNTAHEWTSTVRCMVARSTSIQVMLRAQIQNRTSELGRSQEAKLNENNVRIYEKLTKMEHVSKIGFWLDPVSTLAI